MTTTTSTLLADAVTTTYLRELTRRPARPAPERARPEGRRRSPSRHAGSRRRTLDRPAATVLLARGQRCAA